MQTFVPLPSFKISAIVLDVKRHNKEILESYDAYGLITNFLITRHSPIQQALLIRRFSNHPCIKMWRNHSNSLALYYNTILHQWFLKGYKHSYSYLPIHGKIIHPTWLGDDRVHSSHRSCLLAKNFTHYSQFNWREKPTSRVNNRWPYFWPVK
jgi:hypothetical protein